MTTQAAPDIPPGESGAGHSGGSRRRNATAIFTRPWFWVLLLCALWLVPLLKSLGAEYPEPVPGFERQPETFELMDEQGRWVTCADLSGHILIVQSLDLSTPETAQIDFAGFRERKKRLRGLASLVLHVILVQNDEGEVLGRFVTEKTARKPANLFLIDGGGEVLRSLRLNAHAAEAQVIVLDRHGRIRGAYGSSEEEGDRFAQDLSSLANWEGSDPRIGEAVLR